MTHKLLLEVLLDPTGFTKFLLGLIFSLGFLLRKNDPSMELFSL